MRIWRKNIGWVRPQETEILKNLKNEESTWQQQPLSTSMELNLTVLRQVLGNPQDLSIREFTLASDTEYKAAVVMVEGLAQRELVNEQVLKALMLDVRFEKSLGNRKLFDQIKKYGITNVIVEESQTMGEVVNELLSGDTVFFLDGVNRALMVASRGWEDRSISEPATEAVIRGPRDGFTETLRTNTGLIRRRIKSPDLRLEATKIGRRTQTDVVILYLEGIAKTGVIDEVRRRLQRIDIDAVLESGYIEELIEDSPGSPFPQIEHSERPDKVAAAVLEGRVAILVDTTPFVLMVPTVFWQFMQSAEDYYERYLVGSLARMIRILAYLLSLTLPAIYIALTAFHQEMIPTPLALSIAASREGVPFPAVVEALMMGVTFEILREAGIRLPRPAGQAVSIVGALVIGEAAVQAGIVSQAMVIVVALTGIGSFAVPAYSAAVAGQSFRILFVLLAAALGLFGILAGLSFVLIHMCALQSFGVNYLTPVTSALPNDYKDIAVRTPWWAMRRRPGRIAAQKNREEAGLKPGPRQGDNK